MDTIKLGVIGCGYWGPNLIRNFVEITDSEVVIVADLKEERLAHIKSIYPNIITTKDYRELFKQDIQAVILATPPATHYPFAKEFLEHGYHVFVEKPITLSSQHAEELIQIGKKNDLILMVGHTFEYNQAVQALKDLIDSGELGDIYYLDAARLNLGLYQSDSNVLWDLAPHDISILLYLLNRTPNSVSACGSPCVSEFIHDIAYVNLFFPDNIMGHIHVSWLDPCKVRRVTVVGSKKMVVYNDIESLEKIRIYDKGVAKPPYTNTYGDFNFSYHYGDVIIPNIRFTEPLKKECQHFLDCITNHTEPLSSGESGLKVVKIIEAAQRSLHENGKNQEIIQW
jgi:predicted dehydrogenase